MSLIGNIFWFIFGGIWMGLLWFFIGAMLFLSIIGIPWGKSCFVIGQFSMFPFGKKAVSRKELGGQEDVGTGSLGLVGNIIWFFSGGLYLSLGHLFAAIINGITIIGIPFALQHVKLAKLAIAPIGKTIVPD